MDGYDDGGKIVLWKQKSENIWKAYGFSKHAVLRKMVVICGRKTSVKANHSVWSFELSRKCTS